MAGAEANSEPLHFSPDAAGPLNGIRVLDLSRLVAGNMLSLQLADFGADVIKVEPPEGDSLRAWLDGGEPLFWKTYSRNKRSIVLNLRHEKGRATLWRLIADADVFVENYRPGTLEKMGFAPTLLLQQNPRLVVVRVSGFGQTGPYAQLPGFGTVVEAMSGLAARSGFPDREPLLPPLALADMIAGLSGAMAAVTALFAREHGAPGQVIDLSLLEPLVSILGPEAAIYRRTGQVRQRSGNGISISAPRNIYRCADGSYAALSGSTSATARRIFEIIGRPDMVGDPRFATNAARVKNRGLIDEIIGAWFATRNRGEAIAEMQAAGVTAGPVYDVADGLSDPHFRARGVFVEVEDREFGSIPMPNIAPRLSETPGVWRRPAPGLGEHTGEVLAAAGFSADDIAQMRSEGACA
jgi:crotonobetainyl-CoA:carnitine CoA-transferase CaiB-like acyl-CoA transferase